MQTNVLSLHRQYTREDSMESVNYLGLHDRLLEVEHLHREPLLLRGVGRDTQGRGAHTA